MIIEVKNIKKNYSKLGKGVQEVLKGISFNIEEGDCVGLIGESGSGKSTLSRVVLGLEKCSSGEVLIDRKPVGKWIKENPGKISVVFQDYTSSANPRFTIKEVISESIISTKLNTHIESRVNELLEKVGLSLELKDRYPHELSGGQLQRVCIARAISTNPKFLVLDEAISSLDVSVQAQIMKLLRDLKDDLNLTYLFIAHDLQAVMSICSKILFLYKGNIVDEVASKDLCKVENEYSKKLLSSIIPLQAL